MGYSLTESAGNDLFVISYHKKKGNPHLCYHYDRYKWGFPFTFKNFLMWIAFFLSDFL